MDDLITDTVNRALEKEEDLPDAAADLDDDEASSMDIEHEQIYYLLADAYPEQLDDPQDAKETIHEALGLDMDEKGVDDEEDRTETDDDFNPGNTPDNLDNQPHDEAEWQEDYDAEYGDGKAEEKACEHTDQRGRPLDEEECPFCNNE